jgi:hypothetical protein
LFDCLELRDDDARAGVEGKSDSSVIVTGHSVKMWSAQFDANQEFCCFT